MGAAHHFIRRDPYYRGNTTPNATDVSTPKFAENDKHVRAVMREGGFCAFSERRYGRGKIAVCFPLIWPSEDLAAWNRLGRVA